MTNFSASQWIESPLEIIQSLILANDSLSGEELIKLIKDSFCQVFDQETTITTNNGLKNHSIPKADLSCVSTNLVKLTGIIRHNALDTHFVHPFSLIDETYHERLEEELAEENVNSWLPRQSIKLSICDDHPGSTVIAYLYGSMDQLPLNVEYDLYGILEVIEDEPITLHSLYVHPTVGETDPSMFEQGLALVRELLDPKLTLALCSSVVQRHPNGLMDTYALPIGALTANIIVDSDAQGDLLISQISQLMPTIVIPVENEYLSRGPIYPCLTDEFSFSESDNLAPLQLAHHSLVILDERHLTAGQLTQQSTRNLQALTQLVTELTVPYDLEYSVINVPANVAIIRISLQSKSILPDSTVGGLSIRWHQSLIKDISSNDVPLLRRYLKAARMTQVDFDFGQSATTATIESINCDNRGEKEDLAKRIERDFCQVRRDLGPKHYTEQQLHTALTISKTLAAMKGCSIVTLEDWHQAFSLSLPNN